MKLTMITVNGITKFVMAQVSPDGRVRVPMRVLTDLFGIRRGDCIRLC